MLGYRLLTILLALASLLGATVSLANSEDFLPGFKIFENRRELKLSKDMIKAYRKVDYTLRADVKPLMERAKKLTFPEIPKDYVPTLVTAKISPWFEMTIWSNLKEVPHDHLIKEHASEIHYFPYGRFKKEFAKGKGTQLGSIITPDVKDLVETDYFYESQYTGIFFLKDSGVSAKTLAGKRVGALRAIKAIIEKPLKKVYKVASIVEVNDYPQAISMLYSNPPRVDAVYGVDLSIFGSLQALVASGSLPKDSGKRLADPAPFSKLNVVVHRKGDWYTTMDPCLYRVNVALKILAQDPIRAVYFGEEYYNSLTRKGNVDSANECLTKLGV